MLRSTALLLSRATSAAVTLPLSRRCSVQTLAPYKDAYFAAIHQITNIVRRDIYPERTLNKLNFSVTSELVFRVLRALSHSPTESIRFFAWARGHYTPTSIEAEELIKTLARGKRYASMWRLISQMRDHSQRMVNTPEPQRAFTVSSDTVCFIIEEYGKGGLVDQAIQVFNKCSSMNCEQGVEVYNSLLSALCDVKMFHGAYALIRRMVRKGLVPNKRTYAVLVNGWCSGGKFREAQDFLDEMSRKGFNPPVRGRDLLIEGLLNAGYLETAKDLVRKMTKEGFVPDVNTFNTLVEAICQTGGEIEIDFCVEMYHNVCRLGLCPDINSYKILIPAVSRVGKMNEAFKLLHSSIEQGHKPFPSLYAPIIKGLCRIGKFDDAFCFFGEMKVKGHPPNRPVYTMLITMCGRGGKYMEAASYLLEMTEVGLKPISRCFDLVVDGLKNCGKHDLAKRIEQLEVSLCQA